MSGATRRRAATVVWLSLAWGAGVTAQEATPAAPDVEPQADFRAADARDEALDAEAARIGNTLRCPVCRQQSVTESSSEIAREMQSLIREKLEAGETAQEIEDYFVASYGEWILLQPKARGANLLVYVLPVATFLVGGWLIALRLRRDRLATIDEAGGSPVSADDAEAGPGGDPAVADDDRAWLDAAVRGG